MNFPLCNYSSLRRKVKVEIPKVSRAMIFSTLQSQLKGGAREGQITSLIIWSTNLVNPFSFDRQQYQKTVNRTGKFKNFLLKHEIAFFILWMKMQQQQQLVEHKCKHKNMKLQPKLKYVLSCKH